MAVTAKKRKKLFHIAKELNLAIETIKEFLEKKGIAVTNPNMRVSEDIYELILQRFSHEKKVADKIHKRRELRNIEDQEDGADEAIVAEGEGAEEELAEAAPEETPEEDAPEPVEEESSEEEPVEEEVAAEEEPEVVEVDEPEEAPEEEAAAPEEEAVAPEEEETPEPVEEEEEETVELEAEAVAEPEVEAPEEETAAIELKPQVGDIITDHPMAKKYREQMEREAEAKKERKKKAQEAKKNGEADGRKTGKDAGGQDSPDASADDNQRRKKKDKKKDRKSEQEERDARRKKAFEMLKKEGRKIRPQSIPLDGDEGGGAPKAKEGRKKRNKRKKEVDQKEVEGALKETLRKMQDTTVGKKKRKKVKTEQGEETFEEVNVIKVTEFITTQDLANLLDENVVEIIRKCLELGLVVTINQRLDMDTIKLLAEEFGYEVEEEKEFGSEYLEEEDEEIDDPDKLQPRPPVVTIMGHVDHGKTSLLDYIRDANVVGGESGGITQHIGAYEVELKNKKTITFLDTPGHEAFTAMRARGAQVTDIVVLVIAADDRVMPQTEEALDHAKAAGVSIVIAINKVDKPNANADAIRKQLADRNVLVEDWGGTYQSVEVSAKTGHNVDELLEKILLEAELLELKANPDKRARGVVLEALLDKGKGPVATAMVESGTLNVGDCYVVGQHWGRVRAMLNERGKRVKVAGPSTPVQILGINGVPEAGDRMIVMEDEKSVRDIAHRRQQLKREQDFRQIKLMTLDELSKQIKSGNLKELKLIVKADVDGSAQALTDSLQKIDNDEIDIQVIRRAVGPIAESDVILAAASQAIIIGFHVRPTVKAKELADKENVDIRQYKVIYDVIEDIQKALEGMLEPIEREVVLGTAEIRQVFKVSKIGSIAGCYVLTGKIARNASVRLIRNDVELYEGKLASLKRFKEDVREVQSGYECGLNIEGYNDIKEGDIVEAFEVVMEAQTLKK